MKEMCWGAQSWVFSLFNLIFWNGEMAGRYFANGKTHVVNNLFTCFYSAVVFVKCQTEVQKDPNTHIHSINNIGPPWSGASQKVSVSVLWSDKNIIFFKIQHIWMNTFLLFTINVLCFDCIFRYVHQIFLLV